MLKRRVTSQINIGGVLIGGSAPISIQSMTKTDTRDVKATLKQIDAIAEAGEITLGLEKQECDENRVSHCYSWAAVACSYR